MGKEANLKDGDLVLAELGLRMALPHGSVAFVRPECSHFIQNGAFRIGRTGVDKA